MNGSCLLMFEQHAHLKTIPALTWKTDSQHVSISKGKTILTKPESLPIFQALMMFGENCLCLVRMGPRGITRPQVEGGKARGQFKARSLHL